MECADDGGTHLWGGLGLAAGLVAVGLPSAIAIGGAAWFSLSDAMDPPLIWLMLAGVLGWLAGIAFSSRSGWPSFDGRGPWVSGTSSAP
jgi:hypothetical protein